MSPMNLFLVLSVLFIGLWVAYKIGKAILRILLGLLVLGLLAFAVHHFFLR